MKKLVLIRGLPGAGKSTMAEILGGVNFEADQFFVDEEGNYKFDSKRIEEVHRWCRSCVSSEMRIGTELISVSNTFTRDWEMEPYFEMAEEHGYRVHTVIVENRHGGRTIHGVPEEAIVRMRGQFEVCL